MKTTTSTDQELASYETRDQLRDGREVLIRAIRPDDKQALQDAMHRLSAESSYLRFFQVKHDLSPKDLIYFTELDFRDHVGLVAILDEDGVAVYVGVARYIVCEHAPAPVAELAFAVDDAYHELGIATTLFRHLIRIARTLRVAAFKASVLAENEKMLEVFSHCGLPLESSRVNGVVELRLSLVVVTDSA
jgi:GNAT superfamily N-acetyltransferase